MCGKTEWWAQDSLYCLCPLLSVKLSPRGFFFSRGIGIGAEIMHQSLVPESSLLCNLGKTLNLYDQSNCIRCNWYSFTHFENDWNFHIHILLLNVYIPHKSCHAGDTTSALQVKKLRFRDENFLYPGSNKELNWPPQFHKLPTIVCWSWTSPLW